MMKNIHRTADCARRMIALPLALLALGATGRSVHVAEAAPAPTICRGVPATWTGGDPFAITLVPTANANGASGAVRLRFANSPFGLAVTPDGHHLYELELTTEGLEPRPETAFVAWAATPALDQVRKLGVVDGSGALSSQIHFNKFLVFVTAEPSTEVERWSGPILLRGISRSGRMHTMAGHGPFEGEPC